MSVNLTFSVIHQLVKEPRERLMPSVIVEDVLDCSLDTVDTLVKDVIKLYGTRDNNAVFGTFGSADEVGAFPRHFETFLNENHTAESFLSLTKNAMRSLEIKSRDVNFASGGYLLFSLYETGGQQFLIVAMIKQKEGLQLDENLVPIGIIELDLNKLHQAAKINFSKYAQYQNAGEEEQQELSYLSFVSPKSNQSASGYFIKALGCSKGIAASTATSGFISGITSFFQSKNELRESKSEAKKDVITYLRGCISEDRQATIGDVVGSVRPCYPSSYDEEDKVVLDNELTALLNSDEYQVPSAFVVHESTVNKKARIKVKSDNWQAQLEKSALGVTSDAEIHFDRENRKLTFNRLSNEAINTITDRLRD